MHTAIILVCFAALAASASAGAQTPVEIQKMYDPGTVSEGYGTAVAIAGNEIQLLVGTPYESLGGTVFAYDRNSQGTFASIQTLSASDASVCAEFGAAVAISGTTAVVGSPTWPGACPFGSLGKVYVFTYANGTWTETASFVASDATGGAHFGASVAIDGSTIVVGAPYTSNDPGAAYVFDRGVSGTWTQTQKLVSDASSNQDMFGQSVAIAGNKLVVGMAHAYPSGPGSINFFSRSGSVWSFSQRFDGNGSYYDGLGAAVAMVGSTTAVGVPGADVGTNAHQGAVKVLRYANNAWNNNQLLTITGGAAGDAFGTSVALNSGGSAGPTLIAGAPTAQPSGLQAQGAAYFFFDTGTLFSLGGRLTSNPTGANYRFGGVVGVATGFTTQLPLYPTYFVNAQGAPNGNGANGAVFVFH